MELLNERDRLERIAMLESALELHPNSDSAPRIRELLAELKGTPGLTGPTNDPDDGVGRRAGSPAANQFGTFQVHAASGKQVAFLRSLIQQKDLGEIKAPATLDGISKKSASALIDKLMDRPVKASGGHATAVRLASEKQVGFIRKLLVEKDLTGTAFTAWDDALLAQLGGKEASDAIAMLMDLPRAAVATPAAELKAGAYRLEDGRIVRVYLGQQSGKMLAAELVDITAEQRDDAWNYLGMASRFVPADAHRLTVEEAEALAANGMNHSWCCVCSRRLDDPNSVTRGIGPVCRAKQGGT